jgi:hypothetical protein
MMLVYVDRDLATNVIAVYARAQFGGQESIDDSDAKVVAYYASQVAPADKYTALAARVTLIEGLLNIHAKASTAIRFPPQEL